MRKRNIIFYLIILLCGCDTPSDSFTSLFKSFDRQGMLSNIGNNIVIPNFGTTVSMSFTFNQKLYALKANPNNSNLLTAQQYWKLLNNLWRYSEVYGFGAMDNLLIKPKIDDYHCNTTNIENHISTQPTIDLNFINTVPTSDKGLVAAEYLLFGDGLQDPLTLLSADTQRVNYLVAVAEGINANLIQVQNEWATYISTFVTSDGNNVSSSIGKIINYEVMILDEIKNMKLGKPMGKFDASVIPTEVESYYSHQSIDNIKCNILAIKYLFTGNGGPGFYDLLDHLGAKDANGTLLSNKIESKFTEIETDLVGFSIPLDQAVVSDLPGCEVLYQDVYDLFIMVKVDVMNQLGLLLTFTDNDGD